MSNLILPAQTAASRILRASPRRNRLTKTLGSGVVLRAGIFTGQTPFTFLYVIPIEGPCLAVRLGFLNPYNVAFGISKAKIYPTDSYSNADSALNLGNYPVGPTGSGTPAAIYFDNAGADNPEINTAGVTRSFTMPANTTNPSNAPTAMPIQWSDFVPVTSIPRADGTPQQLLMIAVSVSTPDYASAGGIFPAFNANATANRGRRTYILGPQNNGGTDYADNLAGTNWKKFGSGDQGPLFCLQYLSANPGVQIVLNGDELSTAPTNDNYSTPSHRASWDLSTPSVPIEVASLAWAGAASAVYDPLLRTNVAALMPGIVAYQPNSQHDGAQGQMLLSKALSSLSLFAESFGTKMVLNSAGCQPSYDGNPALQALFTDIEVRQAAMAAQAGIPFIDGPRLIGNVAGLAPWDYLASFSDDNVSPNYAGAEALVPAARSALLNLIF